MKTILSLAFCLLTIIMVNGQELYVYSEPASNMPSKSIGFKLTGRYALTDLNGTRQRYIPEIMFGVNKNWMVHLTTSISDYYQDAMKVEGARLYAKYRFYSNDDVHKHFRMAAFADAAFTRNPYTYMDANLDGDNDGVQAGLIATQLVNKVAVSATASYLKVFTDQQDLHQISNPGYNMLTYSASAGYLLLPREYVDYKQTNLNLYVELLGMRSLDNKNYGVDLAPAVQFIFNSNTKLNLGYRFQVDGNMKRLATKQLQVALEHTLFNAL